MGDIPSTKFRFGRKTNISVLQNYVYLMLIKYKDECVFNVADVQRSEQTR